MPRKDYRSIIGWKTDGKSYQDYASGTHEELTVGGTSLNGLPTERFFIGADIYSNQAMSFEVLDGTKWLYQLRALPAGRYEIKPPIYPYTSQGTSLTVAVSSANGTVSMNVFYM
jgi:hypothetical protein